LQAIKEIAMLKYEKFLLQQDSTICDYVSWNQKYRVKMPRDKISIPLKNRNRLKGNLLQGGEIAINETTGTKAWGIEPLRLPKGTS
jgi:hypothetical protein